MPPFFGRSKVLNSYKQALYVGIIRILANVIMLAAVFIAMYQASRWPAWPSEAVFCLVFFGITIPAWLAALRLTRWARRRWPAAAITLVCLPKAGEQLVQWRVLSAPAAAPWRAANF